MDTNASFEDEIQSINPDYDLIFSKSDETRLNLSPPAFEAPREHSPRKMQLISRLNNIIGNKPVGELPSHKDWEETDSVENETIAMMRTMGLEPSIDQAPDEGRTISTVPTNDDVIIMRNGRKKMSVFMSNSYFKMKPRSEPSFDTDEEDNPSCSTSDLSDGGYMYVPIEGNTSNETETTTVSEDSFKKQPDTQSRQDNKNDELSWRRRSPKPEVTQDFGNSKRKSVRSKDVLNNSSGSSGSSSSWWRSANSSSDTRDDNNWRLGSKPAEIQKEEPQIAVKPEHVVSNCESPFLKPKELFMKKRTQMIQQALANYKP